MSIRDDTRLSDYAGGQSVAGIAVNAGKPTAGLADWLLWCDDVRRRIVTGSMVSVIKRKILWLEVSKISRAPVKMTVNARLDQY